MVTRSIQVAVSAINYGLRVTDMEGYPIVWIGSSEHPNDPNDPNERNASLKEFKSYKNSVGHPIYRRSFKSLDGAIEIATGCKFQIKSKDQAIMSAINPLDNGPIDTTKFKKTEYMAVKLEGYKHWIWFNTLNVTERNGMFIGEAGWGYRGSFTNLIVPSSTIEGKLFSDDPNYN